MGTNIYFIEKDHSACPTCGHKPERVETHIGKSSAGWVFALHVVPEIGINTFDDWLKYIKGREGTIINEYGTELTLDNLKDIVLERKGRGKPIWEMTQEEFEQCGNGAFYQCVEEFMRMNYAEPGPNGLLRSQLSTHCVAHGDGTYDCKIGEFC